MKTKVEIEQLADKYFPMAEKIGGETYTAYRGFMAGYTQCQQDNSIERPVTHQVVKDAMDAVSKDVRAPKSVRDGLVKPLSILELNNLYGDILLEYSKYLEDHGFLDTDWRHEANGENTVEDFINSKKK